MARNIFVSYTERDRALIEHVSRYLRRRGVLNAEDKLLFDRESILVGSDLRKAMRTAIEAADAVLVVWSPDAATSKWVNYEIGMADALGKTVFAVSVGGSGADFPPGLQSTHHFEMPTPTSGSYQVKRNSRGQYSFVLNAPNGEVILRSETYVSKSSALKGIESVRYNCTLDSRYDLKKSSDGFHYFNIKAANNQVIGTSAQYVSVAACAAGIKLVQAHGSIAEIKDET